MASLFCLIALTGGCATHTFIKQQRIDAQHAHSKRTYALTRSLYVSQLYDDNERWLLSERPSREVSHRVSFLGHSIHPPAEVGIVPAGTPVVLERIEFPTRTVVTHRMLNSPLHHIWLRLRPAPGASWPASEARPCVVVLGLDVESPEALAHAIEARFGDHASVTTWLDSLTPSVRAGVQSKRVVRGMDERALVAALGEPRERTHLGRIDGHETIVARYKSQEAWLVDGVVNEIKATSDDATAR